MAESKTWDLWLADPGPKKIVVIKEIRHITQWSLKEAKDFVDAATHERQLLVQDAPRDVATQIEAELQVAGAITTLTVHKDYGEEWEAIRAGYLSDGYSPVPQVCSHCDGKGWI